MKISILGAGGNIGRRIVNEAVSRGHDLNLLTSKSLSFFNLDSTPHVKTQKADIFNTEALANAISESDVVISAYAPPQDNNNLLLEASKSLVTAAKQTNTRLIAVGGAGSLKVNDNLRLIETPEFPELYKSIAQAHFDVLEQVYLEETDLNWTNVSPSSYIFEGERTNSFRIAEDQLIVNDKGESSISMEDFAVGILNEVDDAKFIKKRFTIGY